MLNCDRMGIILKSEIEKGVKIIMDMISDNDSNIQILKSFISDFISSLSSKSFSLGLGLMLHLTRHIQL